jgi:hypothetical protein
MLMLVPLRHVLVLVVRGRCWYGSNRYSNRHMLVLCYKADASMVAMRQMLVLAL